MRKIMNDMKRFNIPNNPSDREKLRGMFKEMSNATVQKESLNELIKDIKTRVKDEFELSVTEINQIFKAFHAGEVEFEKMVMENESWSSAVGNLLMENKNA
jgi:hypothetical protein